MSKEDQPTQTRVLIAEEEIRRRVGELAEQISRDYADKGEVVLIGVLKGAFIFLADLGRRLTIPHRIEFIALSSYNMGSKPGAVRLEMDVRHALDGRHLIVVEDIVDTGRTLRYLLELFGAQRPASIRTCTLVRRKNITPDVQLDYVGFEVPDDWLVGYGLDYAEQNRTLPYIAAVETDDEDERSATHAH